MTMPEFIAWSAAIAGVVLSGLCAGLETGIYSLNRVRLQVLSEQNRGSARVMRSLMGQRTRLLAALLIGTNVGTNMVTSATGVLLKWRGLDEWQIIIADVLIVTPLLFVFAETLPKDLFAGYADSLVYPFSRPLRWMVALLRWTGLLPLIGGLSRLLMRRLKVHEEAGVFHPKRQVEMLVKEGVGWGLLSHEQSAIVERVLDLGGRLVGDEMTPWSQVTTVKLSDAPRVLWELADRTSYSRFPVVDDSGRTAGIVSVYDALVHDRDRCPPLEQLMSPPVTLDRNMPLRDALQHLQDKRVTLAIIREGERPVGVVTIKDLIEPITGELWSW